MFRFEEAWSRNQNCEKVVEEAWSQKISILEKLKITKRSLLKDDLFNLKDSQERMKEIERRLILCQQNNPSNNNNFTQNKLLEEMETLLEKEEVYWRQRSRVIWLKDGDKNTKYFHQKAKQRNARNSIKKIKGSNGEWIKNP